MRVFCILVFFGRLPTILFDISGFFTIVTFHRFFFFKLFLRRFFFKLFFRCVKFYRVVALVEIIILRFFYFKQSSWLWSIVNLFWIFFDLFFVEFIIQFDYYLIENIQLVILSIILYKLIFDIFLQIFLKYIHQDNIILFDTISLSLEFHNIFCCRLCLSYFLNLLFRDSVFVGDIENSANLFLKNFPILEKYFDIDVTGVFQIY